MPVIFLITRQLQKKNISLFNDIHVTGLRQNQVVIVTVNICLLRVMKRLMSFCSAVVEENETQCVFSYYRFIQNVECRNQARTRFLVSNGLSTVM